ncbi:ketosteroid isomerase [Massilia eurypsychrophila]|jgi:ketosteroid isomerase-like protein|uniref:Ketosteroid isomerase n=1 Tax=Massilia eurypsychrophila TaxID=1485217 RepID=A0A2G8T8E8_9BURK|nr:nuclear transport factor 2 family protein [Massilia eurypsychrophila]PIL42327.1 ketosteroid isomerase [Massilia eurypsychrophila]
MNTQQNKQLIMQCYQLYKDKNVKGLLNLFRDDIEWIANDSDDIPFAGSFHGKDQVAQFFSKLEQAQDVIKFEPQDFIAEGDKVVATGISSWHVKSTGLTYDSPWTHIFTVRDGKVARLQQYNHTAAAEAAYRPMREAGVARGAPMQH